MVRNYDLIGTNCGEAEEEEMEKLEGRMGNRKSIC